MGSQAIKPSAAVGRLLRQRRKELKLTLREVSEGVAIKGERIPTSTLARIEQGKLDPGVRRLHMLLDYYEVSPHVVADLVELETMAVEIPVHTDLEQLHREGVEQWKKGDFTQGLASFMAVRDQVPKDEESRLLRQKASLGFAVGARNLGKIKLAKQIVEDVLCEPPASPLMARALVLASSIWAQMGSIDSAMAYVRQAAEHVGTDDPLEAALVMHQKANISVRAGRLGDAADAIEQAIKHYRKSKDTYGESRVLLLKAKALRKQDAVEKAIANVRTAIRLAEKHGHEAQASTARLELGRLLVDAGQYAKGVEFLRSGLSEAVLREDRHDQFYAHYYLWKAYESAGESERARFEIDAARYFVRFIEDSGPEADEVRKLLRE